MARRKTSGGNPFTKGLNRIMGDVGSEVLDGVTDMAMGPKKGNKKTTSGTSSNGSDWATRDPEAASKRRSR
jgi:hypothetical protein